MSAFIANNSDVLLAIGITFFLGAGYLIGSMCKSDQLDCIISEYENLLDLAYEEKLNLTQTIASMGKRSKANLCECDSDFEPFIADSACSCQVCEILRND
jgi:hypothetical protein